MNYEGEEPPKGFKYESATALEGTSSQGRFGYYEGGGYAHSLGKTQLKASKQIDYLIENNWIDEKTRAIFVEFTTYNNQLNLFSVSYIVFEMATTGAFYPKFDVKLVRPERYQSKYGSMVLLSELGMIAYTIYFIVVEIKLLKKLRWAYFKDFWNCVEFVNLSLLSIV
ncbi:polycystin-2-like, partial [Watersipora subatra]|uniref:polycystin-2-like n=1 Tax=Watersipora subatra TaxID=2589382 RepID=UPI00355C1667